MPSTRKRRGRVSKKPEIPEWQLDHILYGNDPEPETFQTIVWNQLQINQTWKKVKNSKFIKDWKGQHGLTFYEQEYS